MTLADDLALALRALSVRIIAPLPGKSVVGIEVANPDRETVYLLDILESDSLRAEKSQLAIALGKDIFGNPTHAELAKMPHLLVAGCHRNREERLPECAASARSSAARHPTS